MRHNSISKTKFIIKAISLQLDPYYSLWGFNVAAYEGIPCECTGSFVRLILLFFSNWNAYWIHQRII